MLRLIMGAVLISFSAVFVKLVSVSPTTAAFYRMFFGGTILVIVVFLRGERFRWHAIVAGLLLLAALFFAFDLALWHRSVLYVGPGIATLLANFQVFILAIAGVLFFGDRPGWKLAMAIFFALVGLVLLVGTDWSDLSPRYHLGIILGLLTAVCYAGYLLALRSARIRAMTPPPLMTMAIVSIMTAVLLASDMLLTKESFVIPSWHDAGLLITYGIFAQVLGWVLISQSLPKVRASQVGLILLLQPTCAMIWDNLFFDRQFTLLELAGAGLALLAIYLGSLQKGSAKPKAVRRAT